MYSSGRHLGRLTEDSVAKMRKRPGQLFMGGLTCSDCGATNVVGTFNILDCPVPTKHAITQQGAKGADGMTLRRHALPHGRGLLSRPL